MKQYVEKHLWNDMGPEQDAPRPRMIWLLGSLLRTYHPKSLAMAKQITDSALVLRIYSCYNYIEPVEPTENEGEHLALNKYNAARCDLIAEWVDPPAECGTRAIPYEPPGDVSHWLATHVLGYTDHHLIVLCNCLPSELENPGRKLLPIIKSSMKQLKGLEFRSNELTVYHRTRYRLLRYYLDAVYHEI